MDTATADAEIDTPETTSASRPGSAGTTDRRLLAAPGSSEPGPTNPVHNGGTLAADGGTPVRATTIAAKDGAGPGGSSASGTAAGTSGAMLVAAKTGPEKSPYLVVLEPPPGASPELATFIAQAESTIQQSVDVLGFGRADPPPPPANGKTPDKVQTAHLPGSGKGLDLYKQQVMSAGVRQDSMVDMDAQVDGTSQMVAAEQAKTLFEIQHIVADLKVALKSVGAKKLKPAEEAAVMDHVAAAVAAVHDKVKDAQNVNVDAAGGGSSGGGGGAGGGAAGAGAMGGLGSMLPMLAMLPMALMPMLGQLPELLGQKDKDKEDDEDKDEAPPSQPAPSPGPAPTDPTTGAPQGATTTPGETAAPNQTTQAGAPQTEIPYGPASPGKQV
ncbi:hypothetical protein [Nocardia sp. CA-290969]|uniref:hypothetical protein n=1 Tax=Nocardia sp. CA-290969 TaxID=3239986 RepID=UPI003D8E23E0